MVLKNVGATSHITDLIPPHNIFHPRISQFIRSRPQTSYCSTTHNMKYMMNLFILSILTVIQLHATPRRFPDLNFGNLHLISSYLPPHHSGREYRLIHPRCDMIYQARVRNFEAELMQQKPDLDKIISLHEELRYSNDFVSRRGAPIRCTLHGRLRHF